MAYSLVTFKAKLDHHLSIMLGVCLSCGFFPCLLPSWILLDMLDGSTVIRYCQTIFSNFSNLNFIKIEFNFIIKLSIYHYHIKISLSFNQKFVQLRWDRILWLCFLFCMSANRKSKSILCLYLMCLMFKFCMKS